MNVELNFIKDMFESIAPKYDFLNRFLSMGQDIYWRKELVSSAALSPDSIILDVACGTCDVSLETWNQVGKSARIFATDFSPKMLLLGKRKIMKKKSSPNINIAAGNALFLPFKKERFNAVFIAFGIRNIMDRQRAISSFYKVLKRGGRLGVLELTTPSEGIFRRIYLFYFKQILPAIGSLFSRNQGAYHYLPESVLKFPEPAAFAQIMKECGFRDIRWKRMTFGIVTLFVGNKI